MARLRASLVAGLFLLVAGLLPAPAAAAGGDAVERVSVGSRGQQGNQPSDSNLLGSAVSADGRYVAFESEATNLVPGDTNDASDVFVRDRVTGRTVRVSVDSAGRQANYYSGYAGPPSISADGRYVVFESLASNLVPADRNGVRDIFLHDMVTRRTERVSLDFHGKPFRVETGYALISGNGRYVVFTVLRYSDTRAVNIPVLIRDLRGHTTRLVSRDRQGRPIGGGAVGISDDGRVVAFASDGKPPTLYGSDYPVSIFVRDLAKGTTREASRPPDGSRPTDGAYAASMSGDGRYVVFGSFADNLVPGDTPDTFDVFVRDVRTWALTRVSVSTDGRRSGAIPNGSPTGVSRDGRYVVFDAPDRLDPADTDGVPSVYRHDRQTGATHRISVTTNGGAPNGESLDPAISADGHTIVYASDASNLVPHDTNGYYDVFAVGIPK